MRVSVRGSDGSITSQGVYAGRQFDARAHAGPERGVLQDRTAHITHVESTSLYSIVQPTNRAKHSNIWHLGFSRETTPTLRTNVFAHVRGRPAAARRRRVRGRGEALKVPPSGRWHRRMLHARGGSFRRSPRRSPDLDLRLRPRSLPPPSPPPPHSPPRLRRPTRPLLAPPRSLMIPDAPRTRRSTPSRRLARTWRRRCKWDRSRQATAKLSVPRSHPRRANGLCPRQRSTRLRRCSRAGSARGIPLGFPRRTPHLLRLRLHLTPGSSPRRNISTTSSTRSWISRTSLISPGRCLLRPPPARQLP